MKITKEPVLGITSIDNYTHDSSIAIVEGNKILFAASEERYSRIKHDSSFPKLTIKAGLKYLNISYSQIKTIAVGYPKRNIVSILKNRYLYEVIPFIFRVLFYRNIKLIIDMVRLIKVIKKKNAPLDHMKWVKNKEIIYVDHHLSHASSGYFTSGFEECISVVLDAFGSDQKGNIRCGAAYLCSNGEIKEISSVPIYASIGLFYTAVTYMLGFKPGDGEGKTMGFAAYGRPNLVYDKIKKFAPQFSSNNWIPGEDWLSGILTTMPGIAYLFQSTHFGQVLTETIKKYGGETVAAAVQRIAEEEICKYVDSLLKSSDNPTNITLSGGVFLNVKANQRIMELKNVKEIFIHPNAGDGGTALGAALYITNRLNSGSLRTNKLKSAGLGDSYTEVEIRSSFAAYKGQIEFKKEKDIADYTASLMVKGKVVGWFQGRSEWGPRALGFRSVLADPRGLKVKDRINQVLKNREWFMPFAPSVLEEEGPYYFKNFRNSPFMTLVFDVVKGKEKQFPAAIHIDNTARVNSVSEENNPRYYYLIKSFHKKTGLPVILNTSFNRHGLPIVNSPQDALDHLLMGAVDELIIGNYSVRRL